MENCSPKRRCRRRTRYLGGVLRLQAFDELVARIQAAPGIAAVTPVLLRLFTGMEGWDATFAVEGQRADDAAANLGLHLEAVAPNYFSTLRVSLIRGRAFTEFDRKGALPVAILGESLARRAWADAVNRERLESYFSPSRIHDSLPDTAALRSRRCCRRRNQMMPAAKPGANPIGTPTPPTCAEPEHAPPPAVTSTQIVIWMPQSSEWINSTVNTAATRAKPPASPTSAGFR